MPKPVEKYCRECKTVQPIGNFQEYRRPDRPSPGHSAFCKPCRNRRRREDGLSKTKNAEKKRARYAENPKRALEQNRDWRYGLLPGQYDAMLDDQGGRCGICGTTDPGARAWAVDHDHNCCGPGRACQKCVRGLLCLRCNMGIGAMQDDPDVLRAAIRYLESHKKEVVGHE